MCEMEGGKLLSSSPSSTALPARPSTPPPAPSAWSSSASSSMNLSLFGGGGGVSVPASWTKLFKLPPIVPSAPVRSRESLPDPPKGMEWVQSKDTMEWRLIKATTTAAKTPSGSHEGSASKGLQYKARPQQQQQSKLPNSLVGLHLPPVQGSPRSSQNLPPPQTAYNTHVKSSQDCTPSHTTACEPCPTFISSLSQQVLRLVSPERQVQECDFFLTQDNIHNSHNSHNSHSSHDSQQNEAKDNSTKAVAITGDSFDFVEPSNKQILWKDHDKDRLLLPGLPPPTIQSSLSPHSIQSSQNLSNTPNCQLRPSVAIPGIKIRCAPPTPTKPTTGKLSATNKTTKIVDHLPTTLQELQGRGRHLLSHLTNQNSSPQVRRNATTGDDAAADDWEILSEKFSNSSSNNTSTGGGAAAAGYYYTNSAVIQNSGNISASSPLHLTGASTTGRLSSTSRRGQQHSSGGSVRSIDDATNTFPDDQSSSRTSSVPFKIQRTTSSSTLDSSEHNNNLNTMFSSSSIGPLGMGVLGVDYVEHVVLPTDTLQGICLSYKISCTKLRQANHFSGNSLLLAPKKLVVPISKKALRQGYIRVQDTDAKEYKVHAFLAEFPDYGLVEAKAYLELSNWNLKHAIRSARDDGEWEQSCDDMMMLLQKDKSENQDYIPFHFDDDSDLLINTKDSNSKSLIHDSAITHFSDQIVMDTLQISPQNYSVANCPFHDDAEDISLHNTGKSSLENNDGSSSTTVKVAAQQVKTILAQRLEDIPSVAAIATKSVQPHDVYKATPQHGNFGVELQSLYSSVYNPKSITKY